jgi:hypothetical protein
MATVQSFSGDDYMGSWLSKTVGRWKAGGIKGALREGKKIGTVAAQAATGNIGGALQSLFPGEQPAAAAPGFDFSFKNPIVKWGAIGAGGLVVLMMLKK